MTSSGGTFSNSGTSSAVDRFSAGAVHHYPLPTLSPCYLSHVDQEQGNDSSLNFNCNIIQMEHSARER